MLSCYCGVFDKYTGPTHIISAYRAALGICAGLTVKSVIRSSGMVITTIITDNAVETNIIYILGKLLVGSVETIRNS
jgi:hypothetical protein